MINSNNGSDVLEQLFIHIKFLTHLASI